MIWFTVFQHVNVEHDTVIIKWFQQRATICIRWQQRLGWQIGTTGESANCHLVINNSFTGDLFATFWREGIAIRLLSGKISPV